jgi:pyrophosphatase PpaX
MIKAVIFDVDGVLIDSLEANFNFFRDLMNKFGHGFMERKEYIPLFHLPMKDIIRLSTKLTNEEEIEKIWKSGKDREVPYPDELLSVPDNLTETIELLSKNYTLGIVTSRSRSGIYSVPQLEGLKEYFKTDVSYEDTDNHKPHPDPLILASRKLGIMPEECVYVGDSETDITAAKAAGMRAIAYSNKVFKHADYNISEFSKLIEAVSNL